MAAGLLAAALSTMACLALVEAGLRLLWDNAPESVFPDESAWHVNGELIPNATGHDYLETFRHNSLGYRGPDYEPDHPGRLRVAVAGDSFIYGIGVSESQTLPAALEGRLRGAVPNVEVINGGQPGIELLRGVKRVHKLVDDYRPDVVLLVMIFNDLELFDSGEGSPVPTSRLTSGYHLDLKGRLGNQLLPRMPAGEVPSASVRARYSIAQVWRTWMYAGLELGRVGTHYEEVPRKYGILHQDSRLIEQTVWQRVTDQVRDLGRWCDERHVRFAMVNYLDGPLDGVPALTLRKALAASGVPTLDLVPEWGDYDSFNRNWSLRYDGHPNRRAHRRAAELAASWMAVQGIIPVPATDEDRAAVRAHDDLAATWREGQEALAASQKAELAELRQAFTPRLEADRSGLGISSDDQWLYGWQPGRGGADGGGMFISDVGGFYLRAAAGGARALRVEGACRSSSESGRCEMFAECNGVALGPAEWPGDGEFNRVLPLPTPVAEGEVLECVLHVGEEGVVERIGPPTVSQMIERVGLE